MTTLIIVRGPLGVGKTTVSKALAARLGAEYVSIDQVLEDHGLDGGDGIPVENFLKANDIVLEQIQKESPAFCILDGCFYYQEQIDDLKSRWDETLVIFSLQSDIEKCIERDGGREKSYGEDAARFVHMMTAQVEEGYVIDNQDMSIDQTMEAMLKILRERVTALVQYREATVEDISAIARVHVDSWQQSFKGILSESYLQGITQSKREAAFLKGFQREDYHAVVAEIDDEIVGFLDFGTQRTHEDEYDAEIYALYIQKAYQRMGIGKGLLQLALKLLIDQGKNSVFTLALDISPYKGFHEKFSDVSFRDEVIQLDGEDHQLIGFGWKDLKRSLKQM